ncbi:MAG: tagaturonate reductase [Ruminococcaceae bacterium]|nr:tagaturonate reductase [Oscillospiraceae bacterium]
MNGNENIIQFGTGAFLRGFADWGLQLVAERTDFKPSVVVVQSTDRGLCEAINSTPVYTHVCRGIRDGEPREESLSVSVLSRCINAASDYDAYLALAELENLKYVISNTTEAGICYCPSDRLNVVCRSFPGKLAQLLYRRYLSGAEGVTVLPCELIEKNGDMLRSIILRYADEWSLGDGFITWIKENNRFMNTLVDRIVTGSDKNAHNPNPLDNASELYFLWVIEGEDIGIPFAEAGLNVIYTSDLEKYRMRKVRMLNGAHTALVPYALLEGKETVLSAIGDPVLRSHLEGCLSEIKETLGDLYTEDELSSYTDEVITRFKNPYLKHRCAAIALNSISKFRVRILPSVEEYVRLNGTPPISLSMAFAKLIELYKTAPPQDDPDIISFIRESSLRQILRSEKLWGRDISDIIRL